jgi:hypothetical protein
VSDYTWGDIPFHYGRWFFDPELGWVWVPGYVWGPAWVAWRAGAGNVGWLPLPPWIDYDGYGPFTDDWNDGYGYANFGFGDDQFFSLWCFVGANDLFAPRISYYVIGPRYYPRFIRSTVGWTRFSVMNGHIVNRSIDRDRFRTTFGHAMPESRRHDFAGRLGPITDYQTGKGIEMRERTASHVLPAAESRPRGTEFRATEHKEISTEAPSTHHTVHHTVTHTETGGMSHTSTAPSAHHEETYHHSTSTSHTTHTTAPSSSHSTSTYHSTTGYHFTPGGTSHGAPSSGSSHAPSTPAQGSNTSQGKPH